nr:FtsX-like permease family protein [Bacteroidota bacterium]
IIVGIINFVNLSTAQSLKRFREIGIRKAIGAYRGQIFKQFILETAIITCIAVLIAIILTEVFMPYLNDFLGNRTDLSIYQSRFFFPFIIVMLITITWFTGLYPAMIMARFQPVLALKGSMGFTRRKRIDLRKSLVVFQFFVSVALIISSITISNQISYIRNKDLGFDKENQILVNFPETEYDKMAVLRSDLLSIPGVVNVTFGPGPASSSNMTTNFQIVDSDIEDEIRLNLKCADTNYMTTTGLNLIAGEWFKAQAEGDTIYDVVVNEEMIVLLGLKNPHEALGRKLRISSIDCIICGVVGNFHLYSLHRKIIPVAFIHLPEYMFSIILKYTPGQESQVLTHFEEVWNKHYPDSFFNYKMYDKNVEEAYEADFRTFEIVRFFSLIAIMIGCLGLFGLVSFMVVQKTKEIGIRKVMGAQPGQIITMLTRIFLSWVLIANLIAWPVAWYAMNRWLENFTYRTSIHWWVFFAAALFSVFIALIAIFYHALRAARTNPVEAIKYE